MNRSTPIALLLALSACDLHTHSSSLELTLKGWAMAGNVRQDLDFAGAWRLPQDCSPPGVGCFAIYGGALGSYQYIAPAFYAPTDLDTLEVSLDLDLTTGVGPTDARIHVTAPREPHPNSTGLYPHPLSEVVLDRWIIRDDPLQPWQAEYVIKGAVSSSKAEFTYEGRASVMPYCHPRYSNIAEKLELCGGIRSDPFKDMDHLAATLMGPAVVPTPLQCPEDVRAVFVQPGELLVGVRGKLAIRSGAATEIPCRTTASGGVICGTTRQIQGQDGCTWDVTALLGVPGPLLNVTGKATGCNREVPHCGAYYTGG